MNMRSLLSLPQRDASAAALLDFLRRFYDYATAHPAGRGASWTEWLAGSGRS